MPHRSALPALLLLSALCHAASAQTTLESFAIDPAASEVTLRGSLTFDFASESVLVPFTSQGTAGATLPTGNPSDGLTTSISGTIAAEVGAATIRFQFDGSDVDPGVSGSWLPGLPGSEATAADGDLALSFADPTLNMNGKAVVRDVRLRLASLEIPLAETGPGTNVFQFDSGVTATFVGGVIDLETIVAGSFERVTIGIPPFPNMAGPGTLERLAPGSLRLTLPVEVAVRAPLDALAGTKMPLVLDGSLSGQIVAQVPEPSAWVLGVALAAALLWLGRIRRHR